MNHAAIVTTDGTFFVTEARFESLKDAYDQLSTAEMVTGWTLPRRFDPALTEPYVATALVIKNVTIKTIWLVDNPTIQQPPQGMEGENLDEKVKTSDAFADWSGTELPARGGLGADVLEKADAVYSTATKTMERIKPETQGYGYSGKHTSIDPW